jgi:hypothetical protein
MNGTATARIAFIADGRDLLEALGEIPDGWVKVVG